MRKSILFLLFLGYSLFSYTQDLIIDNDKNEIKSKVIEITAEVIKYKKYEQMEGPIRNIKIDDVFMIIYEDGTRELFKKDHSGESINSFETSTSSENSTIYFVQFAHTGFEFFHNDRYIGRLKGKKYMVYECPPGKNLFWASSENKAYLPAELKPGGHYIIYIDATMGFWKNHVRLEPVDESNVELYNKVKDLVKSKSPVVPQQSEISEMNSRLSTFIREHIMIYETEYKSDKYNFLHISPDMDVPPLR